MKPLEFDEKARENLEAVERLLPDESGERESLCNAVANRAYYAAYLAVAHLAQRNAVAFTGADKNYYRHDTLADDAGVILSSAQRRILRYLYGMRIKADYQEDPVEFEEADNAATQANQLVRDLLK